METAKRLEMLRRAHDKRMTKDLAKLGCRNMNDTKWDEFFRILLDYEDADLTVRIKLLYEDKPFVAKSMWRPTRRYTEVGGSPFQNREIEWIEIAGIGAKGIRLEAIQLGKLPIVDFENGFRLVAYGAVDLPI